MAINPDNPNGQFIRIDNPEPSDSVKSLMYVKQAGFFTSDNCPTYKGEKQDCLFFMIVLKGSGMLNYNGKVTDIHCGECLFLDCCLPHYYLPSENDPWEVIWLAFDGSGSGYYYERFRKKENYVFVPQNTETLRMIMNKIVENNLSKEENYEIINSKLITDLMTALITDYNVNTTEIQTSFKNKLHASRDYIDAHFTEVITLDKLADIFYMSKFYLTREFKKEFGYTVIQYVLNKRISYAKELLRSTAKSVEEISEICGFNDQSYFARQFKKSENMTCLAYRKKYGKQH